MFRFRRKTALPYHQSTTLRIQKASILCFLFSWLTILLQAQICTGSLGDPVVSVDFGNTSVIGNALPAATTNYTFTTGSCPSDGSYTIVSSSAGCFGDSWHNIAQDHTAGDVNGHIMLVNASFTPGDFFVDTIRNLCANTTYEFSAWVMNVLKPTACSPNPIHPNLVFNIESTSGVVLGTYATGDIFENPSPLWQQYGLFFTTTATSGNIIIRLTNNAPGGCGNDLALDDIAFRPCGPNVIATSAINGQDTIQLCKNTLAPIQLSANIGSGYANPALQWQESINSPQNWTDIPGATNSNFIFNKINTGNYRYRLSVAEASNILFSSCRVSSNVVLININDTPGVVLSSNTPVCEGGRILLTTGASGISYLWIGPGGYTATTLPSYRDATLAASGTYYLVLEDNNGCKGTSQQRVTVLPSPTANAGNSQGICEGDSIRLNGSGGLTYHWSPVESLRDSTSANTIAFPKVTTDYVLTVTNSSGCTDTAQVTIRVNRKPVISAGPDKVLIVGNTVVLDGMGSGSDVTYSWTPTDFLNDPSLLRPTSNITHDTTYVLRATSTIGCGETTDAMRIKVFADLYIPSAFTPNDDGRNDTWFIESLAAYPGARLQVYNRYGELVFASTGLNARWDGRYQGAALPGGAYVYLIDLKNGQNPIKGTVLLIR